MRRGAYIIVFLVALVGFIGCSSEQQKKSNKTLLVSFDGFGHSYLQKTDTPHFDSLVAGGVQAEGLIPVFPSKTFPNHYSIATGLYPENSGFVNNTMYDPSFSKQDVSKSLFHRNGTLSREQRICEQHDVRSQVGRVVSHS